MSTTSVESTERSRDTSSHIMSESMPRCASSTSSSIAFFPRPAVSAMMRRMSSSGLVARRAGVTGLLNSLIAGGLRW